MPTASRASEWSLLPASFQTAWPALQREFPGVQAKFRWGRVHAIYGRPFGGGRTPQQSAENFLSEFGGDLFGINSATELVLGRVSWTGSAPGDVGDNVDLDISVVVNPGSLTLATTDPVKLRYRINRDQGAGGAWTGLAMVQGPPQTYSYTIGNAAYQVGDVIDFYIRAEVDETDKQYTSFPTQAQFDWSTPNADNIPEERDFFSVLVTDSTKEIALSEDLRDDPSWTVGVDEWEFGAPDLAEDGEQPGNDYPFDDDFGGGESPKPNCYFTNATDPVEQGDPWTLITESFDLSGLSTDPLDGDEVVVSYALWFYVRNGQTSDEFTVEIGDGTTWSDPIDTVAATGGTALQRWIRRRVTVDDATQHKTGRKLRFSAKHPSGAGVVEAVVDEVRVWGVIND